MYELKVLARFAAAHQLKMVTEKCENLHGHNWKIEFYVAGKELQSGVLVDFGIIKDRLNTIIDTLDHKFLNELPAFQNANPSSEQIAKYIADEFAKQINEGEGYRVSKVSVWESDDACATYFPPEAG